MMKQKNIALLALLALAVIGICVFFQFQKPNDVSFKTIHIEIKDERSNTVLYSEKHVTTLSTLKEWLLENKDVLVLVGADGEYGYYITSISGSDEGDGYYWVYESDTNQDCKDFGFCPVVDECNLQDKDQFTFKLTNNFE